MKKLRFLVSLTTRDNDTQLEQLPAAQETSRRSASISKFSTRQRGDTQSTQI